MDEALVCIKACCPEVNDFGEVLGHDVRADLAFKAFHGDMNAAIELKNVVCPQEWWFVRENTDNPYRNLDGSPPTYNAQVNGVFVKNMKGNAARTLLAAIIEKHTGRSVR